MADLILSNVAFFSTPPSFSNKINHVLVLEPRAGTRVPASLRRRRSSRVIVMKSSMKDTSQSGIRREMFPPGFIFGASTSALQTESGPADGGRGPSTWDAMIGDQPAVDSLHLYPEDVSCLKYMNMDAYRFSIAWSRLFPQGTVDPAKVNQDGVTFYKNLISELKKYNIEPMVTLFHFDLPLGLQNSYNGFLDIKIVNDFNAYADYCFSTFGDQVKYWLTFNEPMVWCEDGYKTELPIPDDPTIYPYIAAHNLILAHATAVNTYKTKYQPTQGGKIGLPLGAQWYIPYSESGADFDAAKRAWDYSIGWFLDPLVTGDYPFSMKSIVRNRLPTFTSDQQTLVKGSYDFIGINYYTSLYAKANPFSDNDVSTGYSYDIYATLTAERDGKYIGPPAPANDGIYIYPRGLANILRRLKDSYDNPLVIITENGYPQPRDDMISPATAKQDEGRIRFIKSHLRYVLQAIKDKCNVNGYFVWSLMDCMELGSFYTIRYGLNYTDYSNNYQRSPKKSATWFQNLLTSNDSKDNSPQMSK